MWQVLPFSGQPHPSPNGGSYGDKEITKTTPQEKNQGGGESYSIKKVGKVKKKKKKSAPFCGGGKDG